MCQALRKFLEEEKMSVSDLAAALDLPYPTVNRYVNGRRMPCKANRQKIYELTQGRVTPNSFDGYELPAVSECAGDEGRGRGPSLRAAGRIPMAGSLASLGEADPSGCGEQPDLFIAGGFS
jgi:hypothetical protein